MSTQAASVLQVALGTILLLAAVTKVLAGSSLAQFLVAVGLPVRQAVLVSRAVPLIESLIGAWLVSGWLAVPSAAVSCLVSGAFAAVLARAYVAGVSEPCHCFGVATAERASWVGMSRAVLMLAASCITLAVLAAQTPLLARPIWLKSPPVGALGLLVGASFSVIFLMLEHVSSFERDRRSLLPATSPAASSATLTVHGALPGSDS